MTHQNDIRVRVTRYLDDIDVRVTRYLENLDVTAQRYAIGETDLSLSLSLSRIQCVYACGLVRMVIQIRGVIVLRRIVLVVIIRERRR